MLSALLDGKAQFPADLVSSIVVVDNGSTDGSENFTSATFDAHPNVGFIKNDANRGFAVACNQGAAVTSGDVILFLNPDTSLVATSI